MAQVQYSVIIPVYNSAQTLEELFERLKKEFVNSGNSFEIIFVDDDSHDNSWDVLKKLRTQNADTIKIIQLAVNYGQHKAILCGLCNAQGEFIITMDDDLQHPPEEIPKLIKAMKEQEVDLVYGINSDHQPLLKKNSTDALKWLSKKLTSQPGEWSAFRLMKNKLSSQIAGHQGRFFNLDQAALLFTDKIIFEQVDLVKRPRGRSGYSLRKLLSLLMSIIILNTKFLVRLFSAKPSFIIKEKFL
jgi:glycosyltransferase involved in cell wall biosynthesis